MPSPSGSSPTSPSESAAMLPVPANTDAIETATGTAWPTWVERIDALGGRDLSHDALLRAIGRLGADTVAIDVRWVAGITAAYERHIGRRVPGRTARGDFQTVVTRPVGGPMDVALDSWLEVVAPLSRYDRVAAESGPRVSRTEDWRYWRVALVDGSRVAVALRDLPTEAGLRRAEFTLTHRRLPDAAAADRWREYWSALARDLPG